MERIVELFLYMIEIHNLHGDDIGYSKNEMDELMSKFEFLDMDMLNYENYEILHKNGYFNDDEYIEKIGKYFQDGETDQIEFVEFLENKDVVDHFINDMKPNNIKKEGDDWYFYAHGGWSYFSDYFNIPVNYKNDVVEMILNGEGYELFEFYDVSDYDLKNSYLEFNDENLKYIKGIIQNMKNDFEIPEDEIDDIGDFDDIIKVCFDYGLDDLITCFRISYSHAQSYAAESEAYTTLVNNIEEHFNFVEDGLKWVKNNKKYSDTLKIKFDGEEGAKDTIIKLFKINNNEYGSDDYKINYESPYNGWYGNPENYFNDEVYERISDFVEKKYLPEK